MKKLLQVIGGFTALAIAVAILYSMNETRTAILQKIDARFNDLDEKMHQMHRETGFLWRKLFESNGLLDPHMSDLNRRRFYNESFGDQFGPGSFGDELGPGDGIWKDFVPEIRKLEAQGKNSWEISKETHLDQDMVELQLDLDGPGSQLNIDRTKSPSEIRKLLGIPQPSVDPAQSSPTPR